jgi:hypothetical protein
MGGRTESRTRSLASTTKCAEAASSKSRLESRDMVSLGVLRSSMLGPGSENIDLFMVPITECTHPVRLRNARQNPLGRVLFAG